MKIHHYGHGSHTGNIRTLNEDSYLVDTDKGFFVLADGMGGHEGGEVASRIVVDSVGTELRAGKSPADALITAHHEVLEASRDGRGREGMGSTAVALKMNVEEFEIVWIGDSRVYIWDGEQLKQVTKDHSLVQNLVDEGMITAEEAIVHPKRNLVTQAIGMSQLQKMEVGQIKGKVHPDYVFLLCSDGLSEEVSHSEISEVMGLDDNEQQKADLLIQKALENGGSDNVTVILASASS